MSNLPQSHPIKSILQFNVKMVKNFALVHKSNIFVLWLLTSGISYVFFRTLSEDIGKDKNLPAISALIIFLVTSFFAAYFFPSVNSDKTFLERELKKKEFYFLRVLQHLVLSILIATYFSIFPILMKIAETTQMLSLIPALFLFSLVAPYFLLKNSGNKNKQKYSNDLFYKKVPLLSTEVSSVFFLHLFYFFRKNKKNLIAGSFLVAFVHLCLVGLYFSNANISRLIFFVPFLFTAFFALDKNTELYSDLKNYTSPSLKNAFFSDLFFWSLISLVQWSASAVLYLLFNVGIFPLYLAILPLLPVLVCYCLMIKFKYLKSGLLRSLSLGTSLAVPFAIPLFLILFFVEVKSD